MRYGDVMTYRRAPAERESSGADKLARGLGWFSIALGLTEVLAPRALARTFGMEGSETLLRAYGAREIATGIGILTADDPAPWIWGRLGGDALDLATLAAGYNDENPKMSNVGMALVAVGGVTLLDAVAARGLRDNTAPATVWDYSDRTGLGKAPEEMRGAARDFEAPRDMRIPEALRPYPVEPT